MQMNTVYLYVFLFLMSHKALAQEIDSSAVIVDDIQIDVRGVDLNTKGDTATVKLYLISYQRDPREFKLNTFATQVFDAKGQSYLYDSIKMGRVLMLLTDKKNYLNYLLEEEVPIPLQIKISNWGTTSGIPQRIKLVFEDSQEEGKFLETDIKL